MEREPFPPEPPRLIEGAEDSEREWLRAASRGYAAGLDERQAWNRLQQRQFRTKLRQRVLVASLVLAGGAAVLFSRTRTRDFAPQALVTAEPMVSPPSASNVAPPALSPPTQQELVSPKREDSVVPVEIVPGRAEGPAESARRIAQAPAEEPASEQLCRKLTQEGDANRAARCWSQLARGSDVTAQVALYELFRLQQGALAEPAAALTTLEESLRRFPGGALRGEVELGRVRLLANMGKAQAALEASEVLLTRGFGSELARELHLLRGKLYEQSLQDCSRALSEYVSLVGDASAEGDEAEFRRARCLKRLGRSVEARAAFHSYLSRANPHSRKIAEQELEALSAGAPVEAPAVVAPANSDPGR